MKCLKLILLLPLLFCCFTTLYADEATMDNTEQTALLKAIEDYRFSDLDVSIPALQSLHKKHPHHLKTSRYLALSYQENMQYKQAIETFHAWLNQAHDIAPQYKKFAYLGIASAELNLKNYDACAASLQSWLKIQPDDMQARTMLGDLLIRTKDYKKSSAIWNAILKHTKANSTEKAGAWYYKAWISYLNRDMKNTHGFANASLTFDSKGTYATPAKNLLTAPPLKKLGFSGGVTLGVFHHSNVELLPDIIKSVRGSSDKSLQTDINLNWAFLDADINYVLSSTKYQNRTDFDILLHLISASLVYDVWQLTPSVENVSLGNEFLYQGLGLAIYYNNQDWTYHYAVKTKTFNDAFGITATDLSRLGGINHNIGLGKSLLIEGIQTMLTAELTSEQTKGDLTHNKTDDYLQMAVGITTTATINKDLTLLTTFNIYNRDYAHADTSILINPASSTARSDLFTQISTSAEWKPLTDKDAAFLFHLSYQSNTSNYDTGIVSKASIKSYSAWKVGSSFSKQW